MFDHPTVGYISVDFVILTLIYMCLSPVLIRQKAVSKLRLNCGIFLSVLFCVLALWSGDWYHYKVIFEKLNEYSNWTSHMEGIYDFLIKYVCPDYLSFRLLVWGTTLGFYYMIVKRLGLNQYYAWTIFGLGFLPFFSYARASIVPATFILGATFIFVPMLRQKKESVSLGLLLIFLSVFLHKSGFLGVLIMLFCFVVPQTTKNSWFYFLLGFVVASFTLQYLFRYALSLDFGDESYISYFTERARDTASSNFYGSLSIGPRIVKILEQVPYVLTAILAFKIQNEYQAPKGIMTIIKFEFYMVFFSLFFLLDLGASTSDLYVRYLRYTIISGAVTLAYAYQYGLFKRYTKFIIWLSVFCSFYQVAYEMYCKLMNQG